MQHASGWRNAVLAVLCGLAGVSTALADDSLRCKNKLVSLGNSPYDVQALCGPPDFARQRVERRAVRNQVRANCGPNDLRCSSTVIDSIEVPIDEWTYDFGSNRLVQYLTFEAGKLIAVRTGNYGHKPPQ